MFVVTFGLRNRIIPIIKIRRRSEYYVDKILKMTEKLVVSPQTCVPGIKESPHFCRDSDYISDYCTLKI